MEAVKYADLLDEQGNINYFSVDNLYNEERIKGYYKTKESLFNAYNATNHFNDNGCFRNRTFGRR